MLAIEECRKRGGTLMEVFPCLSTAALIGGVADRELQRAVFGCLLSV